MNFKQRVYRAVRKIPLGRVAIYGQIAKLIGNPGAARAVGNILHQNPSSCHIPCHRVVDRKGQLALNFAFGGISGQREKLAEEGVEVSAGKVNLKKFGLRF